MVVFTVLCVLEAKVISLNRAFIDTREHSIILFLHRLHTRGHNVATIKFLLCTGLLTPASYHYLILRVSYLMLLPGYILLRPLIMCLWL
ncbi:hypothetical protein PHET_12100 [Paragonimus heterotremus]|uniref:Uncharacterized protein n=1 Tax=Paragonimus heterotremus TaxID=100268 RepID=A0A8J4SRC5_9TREM|nr:hypothetical protein PHET_12100 [Paragonimus heterotremus]